MRRARHATPVAALLCVALVVLVASAQGGPSSGAAKLTPRELYKALLATPIPDSQLPAGFSGATVARTALTANARHHHAIGEVTIELNRGLAAIAFDVFPTRADVLGAWKDSKPSPRVTWESTRTAPGFPKPALIKSGSLTGKSKSGKTVTVGVTAVTFVVDTVGVAAGTQSTTSTAHGDVQSTVKLARAALAHLRGLQRTVPCSGPGNVIAGTKGDDMLVGTSGADTICGGPGDDTIRGLAGDDVLRGGAGNDVLRGGEGSDRLFGGAGNDKLVGGNGADKLWGQRGNDKIDALGDDGTRDVVSGGPGDDLALVTAAVDPFPAGIETLTTCGQIAAGAGPPDCRTRKLG